MENSSVENNDETLEFPLRFSKICLLNIRDDNAFISPLAIETAFHVLASPNDSPREKFPLYFYNYLILDQDSSQSLSDELNAEVSKYSNTEFQYHNLTDLEQRKNILNEILKDFSQRVSAPVVLSQKILGQIIVEPMTLVTCSSFIFRPMNTEYWEQLWSVKFQSNVNLAIETEFYFTKGFFRAAFHETFHKIEIPGQINEGIQMNLIILLPRCSSDLVHLYANIKEYLSLPYTSAFVGVCLPKICMDVEINLIESIKSFDQFNEQKHLAGARFLGHFSLDMSTSKTDSSSSSKPCLHSIDLSPITPWVFVANRPFLFIITSGDTYLLMGQMLGPKVRHPTAQYFSKYRSKNT